MKNLIYIIFLILLSYNLFSQNVFNSKYTITGKDTIFHPHLFSKDPVTGLKKNVYRKSGAKETSYYLIDSIYSKYTNNLNSIRKFYYHNLYRQINYDSISNIRSIDFIIDKQINFNLVLKPNGKVQRMGIYKISLNKYLEVKEVLFESFYKNNNALYLNTIFNLGEDGYIYVNIVNNEILKFIFFENEKKFGFDLKGFELKFYKKNNILKKKSKILVFNDKNNYCRFGKIFTFNKNEKIDTIENISLDDFKHFNEQDRKLYCDKFQ